MNEWAFQYNAQEKVLDFDINDHALRNLELQLGRWQGVDPYAEDFSSMSPYCSMGNNPISYVDPGGGFIMSMMAGAAIGAGISGLMTIAANSIAGNNPFHGIGKSMLMGAVGGALGGGLSAASAGGAFGQSTGLGILNNVAANTATSIAFRQDITLGSFAGSMAGGFVAGQLPQFTGVKGGSFINALAETAYKGGTGTLTGAVGGGLGAAIDGRSVGQGVVSGAGYGAIGGSIQAGLNIITLGPTYIPKKPERYGNFGRFKPVYRKGSIFTPRGSGIALGRNMVTKELKGNRAYNDYLRAHETGHFEQQRRMGFTRFYLETLIDYIKYKDPYGTPGTLEFDANRYSLHKIGYYYYNGSRYYK